MLSSALLVLLAAVAPLSAGTATPAPEAPAAGELTIAAVGDIMLGHRAEPWLEREGPGYFFVHVLPVLQQAQVVIGNLESPVSSRGTAVEGASLQPSNCCGRRKPRPN